MTDDELDEMTQQAIDGTLDEAMYDRLTDAAERNWSLLLADPEAMARVMADAFVPTPGEEPEVCIDCGRAVDPEVMICEACYYRDNPE